MIILLFNIKHLCIFNHMLVIVIICKNLLFLLINDLCNKTKKSKKIVLEDSFKLYSVILVK